MASHQTGPATFLGAHADTSTRRNRIEAASYFLSDDTASIPHRKEYETAIDHLVDLMESAQQPDGYLNIYFTVVDPAGRFKNFRDMHEMCEWRADKGSTTRTERDNVDNAGHLLEGALAHHQYTGLRRFLDIMIKVRPPGKSSQRPFLTVCAARQYIDCLMKHIGPNPGQMHAYPGHPELELAVVRLYAVTRDPRHKDFAEWLVGARGVKREDQEGDHYFVYEAKVRDDPWVYHTMDSLEDQR